METARKTLSTALDAGTAVLEKARDLPHRLQELPTKIGELPHRLQEIPTKISELPARIQTLPTKISELPQRFGELPHQLQAIPGRVSEFVTLPESLKVGSLDLRDLGGTLQGYAAKGTERARELAAETRENARKYLQGFTVTLDLTPSKGVTLDVTRHNGVKKAAKASKPRTAKKAVVVTPAE